MENLLLKIAIVLAWYFMNYHVYPLSKKDKNEQEAESR